MLVQTNTYIVPASRRQHHARLMRRFREALLRMGCDQFEILEESGEHWSAGPDDVRCVQIMRFRDKQHHQAVQAAERTDTESQALIKEFASLIDLPAQAARNQFVVHYYTTAAEPA